MHSILIKIYYKINKNGKTNTILASIPEVTKFKKRIINNFLLVLFASIDNNICLRYFTFATCRKIK